MQDISIDAYISPQELSLSVGSATVQEEVALLIQQFGENIVLPHLHRFTVRSQVEGIQNHVRAPGLFIFNSTF